MSDLAFNAKIQNLYKHIAEGWSPALSESKAGLLHSKDYQYYRESEHYDRIRTIHKGRKQKKAV